MCALCGCVCVCVWVRETNLMQRKKTSQKGTINIEINKEDYKGPRATTGFGGDGLGSGHMTLQIQNPTFLCSCPLSNSPLFPKLYCSLFNVIKIIMYI